MPNRWSRIIKPAVSGLAVEPYAMVEMIFEAPSGNDTTRRAFPLKSSGGEAQDDHDSSNLKEQAYRAGVEAGVVQGRKQASHEAEVEMRRAMELAAQVALAKYDALRQAENDMVDIALAIAGKVIHRESTVDRAIIEKQVHHALSYFVDKGLVRIRVNPEDVEQVEKVRPHSVGQDGTPVMIHIEGDPSIQRGGCLLESTRLIIDATVDSQLRTFGEELREPLANSELAKPS